MKNHMPALAALLLAAPAIAQTPAPVCTPELATAARGATWAKWVKHVPAKAGGAVSGAPAVAPGTAVRLTLLPVANIRFAAPQKADDKPLTGNGGIVAFAAPKAGRYRVALETGAWIDVLVNGRPATSVAHGHGEPCSGIRKIVDFDLPAGNHLIQISNNEKPETTLMVSGPTN